MLSDASWTLHTRQCRSTGQLNAHSDKKVAAAWGLGSTPTAETDGCFESLVLLEEELMRVLILTGSSLIDNHLLRWE